MTQPQQVILPDTDIKGIHYEIVCEAFIIKGPTIESVIMKWTSLRTCVNSYSEIKIKWIATVGANGSYCIPGDM